MRKMDLRKLRKIGETFTLDFYYKGELIYKVIGVPTKGQTQFFFQEIWCLLGG